MISVVSATGSHDCLYIFFVFVYCLVSAYHFYLKDPEIRSLPDSNALHEDTDDETWLHNLVVYDYNYHWEDNITCHVKHVHDIWNENDQELFDLRQDDTSNLYSWNCKSPFEYWAHFEIIKIQQGLIIL